MRKCEACGAEWNESATACPACGATRAAGPKQSRGGRVAVMAAAVVVGLLAVVGVAKLVLQEETPPSEAIKPTGRAVDVKAVTAKAEAGDAAAQNTLGKLYTSGEERAQDFAKAAEWYRKAADQGYAPAQSSLGELYEAGQGVPLDQTQALQWYRRAAEQGDVGGQYRLAIMYTSGRGTPKDAAKAVKWYRAAADQGEALAQFNLGRRYNEGVGVNKDLVEAYKWLDLAARQGITDSAEIRDELKRKLTKEQLEDAQSRVAEFLGKSGAPAGSK
jgi:uncharacterized protein